MVELLVLFLRGGEIPAPVADAADTRWLCDRLNRESRPMGVEFTLGEDGGLISQWWQLADQRPSYEVEAGWPLASERIVRTRFSAGPSLGR